MVFTCFTETVGKLLSETINHLQGFAGEAVAKDTF
jgi:hypothetical protein